MIRSHPKLSKQIHIILLFLDELPYGLHPQLFVLRPNLAGMPQTLRASTFNPATFVKTLIVQLG